MDTNEMIKAAIEKYRALHGKIEEAHAVYPEYLRTFNWLLATRQMFPDAFSNDPEDPKPMLSVPPETRELPSVDQREFEPPNPMMAALDKGIRGVGILQDELRLADRRMLNEKALKMVEDILAEKGPLKLDAIISEMHLRKWVGYPTDDPVSLYNALQTRARRKERFQNLGENTWNLIKLHGGEP